MDEELFLLNHQVSKEEMEEIQKRQAAEAMQASDSEIAELKFRIYQMEQERLLEKRQELQFNMMQSAILQNMQGTYTSPIGYGYLPPNGYHYYGANPYGYTPNLNVYSPQFIPPNNDAEIQELRKKLAEEQQKINRCDEDMELINNRQMTVKSKPVEIINIEPVKKKSFAEKVAEKLDGLDALKDKIADFVWDNIL